MKLCNNKCERRAEVEAMTHEERLKYASRLQAAGIGLIVSAVGCFAGVLGGLSGSIGAGAAVGAAIGSASGLLFAGIFGPLKSATQVRKWDREIMAGGGVGDEEAGQL